MAKRKVFARTDLNTPRVEHARSESGRVVIPLDILPPAVTAVKFPHIGGGRSAFDFAPWYGAGIDSIVYACQRQIERFLDGQDAEVTQSTVQGYCDAGLRQLLSYLTTLSAALGRELTLDVIDRACIDGLLSFLRDSGVAPIAQKTRYGAMKAVLKALAGRGLITEVHSGDDKTFPRNPFPGAEKSINGETPLSKAERQAFSRAVKTAVMPIFDEGTEITSELLAYALLVIALHTGRNTQPLLEITPNCLRSHPKENTHFLVLYKRRGHASNKVAIRAERGANSIIESLPTIRPTVANLLKRVIELSAPLRDEAPPRFKDRVWLYRMRRAAASLGHVVGSITPLTPETLRRSILLLVDRYQLIDADGKPLRLNVSRLRKTFINRVYEILDGDVVATAVAAGNTVHVTDINYLQPGEDAQKNWRFLGLALVEELLANTIGATERTPVGQCSDTRNGDYAPKRDGAVCMSFFNCIRCRNYVVTADDLYRLFSFYWRILRQRTRMAPTRWKQRFSHIVRLIEKDVIEQGIARGVFKPEAVSQARERARHDPHPFWRSDTIIADLGGLAA